MADSKQRNDHLYLQERMTMLERKIRTRDQIPRAGRSTKQVNLNWVDGLHGLFALTNPACAPKQGRE